jgi:serine/threonine protein kinase/tetratricopeptide (TPR) repeat protein
MALSPGSQLGGYEIIAMIGAGGMGEVYRARDTRLGRDVAIKVLPAQLAADPTRIARFEREARTVAGLSHPNIVVLHSIEQAGDVHFLTMELVEGTSLDRIVASGGLPIARVLAVAIPLTEALAAAHARNIVHRDLKPANVILGRDDRVKVLDFGLAKNAMEPTGTLDVTQAQTLPSPVSAVGQLLGTVPYMAPEQVRGEPTDARTDLFALGVLLYELVTGARPFGGPSMADISSAILRDVPVPLANLRKDVPAPIASIVERCLKKDPRERFQTAVEVHQELCAAQRALDRPVTPPRSQVKEVPSIAVLPFVNRSRSDEDEYFSDGLADELMNLLAKIRGLRVAARTSAFHFKGKDATIASIGSALNVATVLEGSVRKAGARVRIAVQLVKVADGFHLWSETYDRTLDDIFAVQDDIARAVVKELKTTLLGEEADSQASGEARAEVAAAAQGRTADPQAHRLVLQARHFIDRVTREDVERGISYLKEALALAPDDARTLVELANGYMFMGGYGWSPVTEVHEQARAAIHRALTLAPELPEAYAALSRLQSAYDFDFKGANASIARALALAPDNVDVLRTASNRSYSLGRLDEAIDLMRRTLDQDPLSASGFARLAMVYRAKGAFAEARAASRRALELSPNRVGIHLGLAAVAGEEGNAEEALREARLEPAEWARLTSLAVAYHLAGRHEDSDAALRELIDKYAVQAGFQIAAVYGARGEVDAAFDWLDRCEKERDSGLSFVKPEPFFRSCHRDPRWPALLTRLGLDD